MNERDGYIVEMALDVGFTMTNDDGDEYACTEAQLLEFWRRSTSHIEKLEAALQIYSCDCSLASEEEDCELGDWTMLSCGYRARKALEGKDD